MPRNIRSQSRKKPARPKARRPKTLRRVASLLYGQPLAITEAKLHELCMVFEAYRDGVRSELAGISAFTLDADDEGEDDPGYQLVGNVAVLSLNGTITKRPTLFQRYSGGTSCEQFRAAFDLALADERAKAIVLDTDSPGGEISGVDELSRHVFSSRGAKPIYAVANSLMASAAYYIASAADQIITEPTAMVGSIGVLSAHVETSKRDQALGVKWSMIHAGKHKVDGNPHEPLSKQGRGTIQELVDDAYGMFLSAVARNRGVSAETVEAHYGQGKVFLGEQAVKVGLADRVGTMQELLEELQAAGGKRAVGATEFTESTERRMQSTSVSSVTSVALNTGDQANQVSLISKPKEDHTVDPKIKAALVARGLIAPDASDVEASIALRSFLAARGVSQPATAEATVELIGSAAGSSKPKAKKKTSLAATLRTLLAEEEEGEDVDAEDDEEDLDAEDDDDAPEATSRQNRRGLASKRERKRLQANAAAEERARVMEIQSRGRLLGASQQLITAAIDSGKPVGDALVMFTDAASQQANPVGHTNTGGGLQGGGFAGLQSGGGQGGGIFPIGSETDTFTAAAAEVLVAHAEQMFGLRGERAKGEKPKPLSAAARGMRYMRLSEIAARSVQMAGVRTEGLDAEDVAAKFLELGGRYTMRLESGESYARPGDYPNVLSAVFGKTRDAMLETNTATFRAWCAQRPSVPDFHPRTVIAVGSSGELDYIPDGKTFPEGKNGEHIAWISTDVYGKKQSLTPRMIAGDELGVFLELLMSDLRGHDLTLNRLAVELLTGNPVLHDSVAAFHSTRGNVIAAADGGAPSITQADKMRLLMRNQTDIGGNNKLRVSPSIVLTGSKWETVAQQVFLTPPDGVYYQADTSVNVFRNKVTPIVEQMLDDHAAANGEVYYGFADPRVVAAIIFMYQTGYENGKVESWYDPETKCRKTSVEGRFGVAINQWRGMQRNSGGNSSF